MNAGSTSLPVPDAHEITTLATRLGLPPALVRIEQRGRLRVYRLTGDGAYDYLALPPGGLDALHEDARAQGADLLVLEHLVGLDPTPAMAPYLREASTRYFDADAAPEGWGEILGSRDLKRKDNRIRRETAYRCEHEVGDFEDESLRALMDLHVERWRYQGPPSRFEEEAPRRLMEAYPRENKLLTRIYDGDELVAAHFGMLLGGVMVWHTPAINVKYQRHSPLMQLFLETARWCEANGVRVIDLGLGQESYKARVSNADRTIWQYVRPVSVRGLPMYAAFRARKRWADQARPVVEKLAAMPMQLKRKASHLKHTVRVYERDASADGTPDPARHYATLTDWPALVDLCRANGVGVQESHYERLRRGDTFVYLHDGAGQVLSYGWASTLEEVRIGEVGRTVDNRGRTMLFDFWTPDRHRGKGHYTELLRRIVSGPEGARYQIFVLSENTPSRRAIERVGFRLTATLRGRLREPPPESAPSNGVVRDLPNGP